MGAGNDRFVVRVVVLALAVLALAGLLCIAGLALSHTPIPDPINSITSAAAGALGAVLARTSIGGDDPTGGANG